MANGYWSERNKPYQPGQDKPFKISRSKIELFVQCKRCFWLDVRLKITRPSTPPFNINKAIDELFKKEFDKYREDKKPHPIMVKNKLKAIPFQHKDLNKWRANFTGVSTVHEPTNLHIFGAVDDVWIDSDESIIVVDYKATSKNAEINIDSDWQIMYKRQMEIYQWLLKQNGFNVLDSGYFVYTNALQTEDEFDDRLKFKTKLIEYKGNSDWVEKTILNIKECIDSDEMPEMGIDIMGGDCKYCTYSKSRTSITINHLNNSKKQV